MNNTDIIIILISIEFMTILCGIFLFKIYSLRNKSRDLMLEAIVSRDSLLRRAVSSYTFPKGCRIITIHGSPEQGEYYWDKNCNTWRCFTWYVKSIDGSNCIVAGKRPTDS